MRCENRCHRARPCGIRGRVSRGPSHTPTTQPPGFSCWHSGPGATNPCSRNTPHPPFSILPPGGALPTPHQGRHCPEGDPGQQSPEFQGLGSRFCPCRAREAADQPRCRSARHPRGAHGKDSERQDCAPCPTKNQPGAEGRDSGIASPSRGENGPGAKLRGPRGPGGGVLSRPGRLSLQSLSPSDPYIRARASPCRWVNRGTPQGMGRDWRLAVSCPSRLRTGTRGSQLHTFPARPSASSAGLGSGTAGRGPLMLLLPLPWGCRRAARRPICRQRSVVGRKLGPTLFPEASHCSGRLPTRAWAPRPRPSWTSVSVHPGPSLPPEGRDGQQPAAQGVAGRGGRGWG